MTGVGANAQVTFNTGDLVLGFRASAGAGTEIDYCINLGTAATFRDATSIQTVPLTGVAADLVTPYGNSWHTRTDLHWGIVGPTSLFSTLNADPANTLYATRVEPNNGTSATSWTRENSTIQSSTNNTIRSVQSALNSSNGTPATNATAIAKTIPPSVTNSWSWYQPGGDGVRLSANTSYNTWNPTIEGNPSQYLNLFRLTPSSQTEGVRFVGRFVLNSNATLTFIPGALVNQNVVAFSDATFSATEDAVGGVLNVTVSRTGDTTIATTVTVSTTDGSALAGTDYTALTNQNVTFNAGETSKTVPVSVVNRAGTQGDRDFTIALGGATGGTTIGTQGTATCTISDGAPPSEVQFSSATYSANQGALSVVLNFSRTGGTGAVTFTLTTTDDTAVAGTDYTTFNAPVTIPANASTGTATITLAGRTTTQHLQFNVAMSNPVGNDTIGSRSSAIVRLLTTDNIRPSVTVTAPAASVNENPGDTVTITGASTDDKTIIDRVQIRLNGAAPVLADLTPNSNGATYNLSVTPRGGINTFTVQAFDARGNASAIVTRTFTYVVKRAIAVQVVGNGTVTGLKTGIVYEVGKPITLAAKAGVGAIFDSWSATGLTGPALEFAALNIPMTDAFADSAATPTITVTFVSNPFVPAVIGTFNGLILEDGTGDASNATNGSLNLTVTSVGTFTGTMRIDGLTIKTITGAFDNTGVAKFGTARTLALLVPRPTKPSYELALTLDLAPAGTQRITGTLKQKVRTTTILSNSIVTLDRAAGTVPVSYLVNKGFYTLALQPQSAHPILLASEYPQGYGVGSVTVAANGTIKYAGTLADGTPFSGATTLSKNRAAGIHAPLYKGAGSFGGMITFDDTLADTDVAGADMFWFRPWQNVHHYPFGWPEGINVDLVGAKFAIPVGASVLPDLTAATPNATLSFMDGLLPSDLDNDVQVAINNAVTSVPPGDTTFKATITAAKGTFAGDFTHDNGSRPKFSGIILQKGANKGGYGFFLTVTPKPITGLGQVGAVTLLKK
jgi:hypothetical protein